MKLFIVFTTVLVVAHQASTSSDVDEQWKDFKKNYEKNYETEAEENLRKEIFAQNLKKFDEHNKKYEEGSVLYTMGVNQFADITTDEFLQLLNPMNVSEITGGIPFVPLKNVKPPRSIDWRKRGAVTPVKDQKGCGSCYAFSGTGALEGQLFRKTKKLIALSEQNLIDCSQEQNNAGCKGGYVHSCYQYVRSHGINSEKSYPYEGKVGECRYNPRESVGTTKGFVRISKNDEDDLLHTVGLIGPVSVLLTFGPLLHYTGGVFDGVCKPNKLNHAVLAVGYGTTKDGRDYWIIKNSHGLKYGEVGYLRLLRNKNLCGIASVATYPIV